MANKKQPIGEGAVCAPSNPYAHSKFLAEEMCRFYHRHYGLPVTLSRPFNIYGPGQSKEMFIPFILEQLAHDKISVNDLSPKRDYVHLEDVISALLAIKEHGKNGEVYNIGTGVSHSCGQVIDLIQKIAKSQKEVVSKNRARPEEVDETLADISKIQKETGWKPGITLEEGN